MTSKDNGRAPVAIVTGAARRIGAAIAGRLHARGHNVVIHCRGSRAEADALAARLNDVRADSARVVQVDLADSAAPERIVTGALDAFGGIDVLVNNASAFYPTPVDQATQAHWDELMASNLRAPFFLSQACAPHLSRRDGAIVNLVDIHALVPMQRHAIYSQAKAGLVMQTRSLARELAPDIRVNAVAPGAILWPEHDQSPEAEAEILDRIPMQRPGRPEDIAGAVAFLALDAPYITGQVLAVDGGRLLNM
ncbi:pteridine reductase [Wenzhouxiangella sp. AB-CW3]|uniref:pteridine reductase n=1 Tax=Wenzhouxiangella sp. AB-CW3 TaxID=2771012 RepID=UPI00398C5137